MIGKRKAGARTQGIGEGLKLDSLAILNVIPDPIIVVDGEGVIVFANPAAESFLAASLLLLRRQKLSDIIPFGSPLLGLVDQVRNDLVIVSEYGVDIGTPKIGAHTVNVQVTPLVEIPGHVVIQLEERSIASKMDQQLTHRGAARSVTAMASMLAHEVKNPLSGIRGAAQLLEQSASDEDRALTRLICDEADRIVALVDRMEAFSDDRPIERSAVNIHQVLEHVRQIAENGFAKHVRFEEEYDPSLPPVLGNRDQLIQVFLNLVKNAAEVLPAEGGVITLTTAYRHGIRLAAFGNRDRLHLPLEIGIADNGPGIPEDLRQNIFDPFVSTKANGSGLGLALVAKLIGDHGGIIECEDRPKGTRFVVRLPVADR